MSGCVQVVENWYPGAAKDKKGVLLVVTAGKEGALSGGDSFMQVWGCIAAGTVESMLERALLRAVRTLGQHFRWPLC